MAFTDLVSDEVVTDPDGPDALGPAQVSAGERRPSRRRKRPYLWAYLLLAALFAGALAWFIIEVTSPDRENAPTGDGAVAAASAQARNLMDLDYRTAKADLQRVIDGSIGDMRDSYSKAAPATIASSSTEKSVSTGVIRSVGLSSFSGKKAEVLVAGDATVAFPKSAKAAASTIQVRYRFRVEMEFSGGSWKSSQLNFAGLPSYSQVGS
jgi:Mce-associated membrane protein